MWAVYVLEIETDKHLLETVFLNRDYILIFIPLSITFIFFIKTYCLSLFEDEKTCNSTLAISKYIYDISYVKSAL